MYAFKYADLEHRTIADRVKRSVVRTDNLMLANVEFSDGPCDKPDPFHEHPHEQVSYIVEGEIILFVGNEPGERLCAGDHFAIPSGIPHTIQRLTEYVKIIDCFTPIRKDFL